VTALAAAALPNAGIARVPPELLARLDGLAEDERKKVLSQLSSRERQMLAQMIHYDWNIWAREKQKPPEGNWRWWIVLAGRMFGKTRTGAEWVRACAESGKYRWITIVGQTREAVNKVMLHGPAGILSVCPPEPWFRPVHSPSHLTLTWPPHPVTGVVCTARIYSAERPERLRGEQHEIVWLDEVAAWPRPDAFHQVAMGLRLAAEGGLSSQALITTTPRSSPLILDLVLGQKGPDGHRVPRPNVVVVRGVSEENTAVDPEAVKDMRAIYGDTPLGRQELDAELRELAGDELWTQEVIDACRVSVMPCAPKRTIVAVDPTRSESPSDECGIIAASLGVDGHVYILEDASRRGSPYEWTQAVLGLVRSRTAGYVVYEQNRLGKTAQNTIRAADLSVKWEPVTATQGKELRAEPVSMLYSRRDAKGSLAPLVHHVGEFPHLEDEMTSWSPNSGKASPNRLDALTWAVTDLLLRDHAVLVAPRITGTRPSGWRTQG
jgi:phage terminase large subunit-like protein